MNGLLLVGGQSFRMGQEKRLIQYHDLPQEQYLFEVLSGLCSKVFLSCNATQALSIVLPKIIDFDSQGPLSGIRAAFDLDASSAWLVLACDLPNINTAVLGQLIAGRNPEKLATAFFDETSQRPEPLIAIYEPAFMAVLLDAQKKGVRSPMSLLLNNDYEKVVIAADVLLNINTQEEKKAFEQRFRS